jgi:RimJ/RimL family protein N-acetyltransferase
MVRTTLPVLPPTPPTIQTPRLLLRPFLPTDLPHYTLLRRQPEVMKWTSTERCDETVTQTQEWMARFLPSEDPQSFSFSIEELDNPGIAIGSAGCFSRCGKQPELGYMLRKEMWGKGYATEAVQAALKAYWELERKEVEGRVEAKDVEEDKQGREQDQELAKEGNNFAEDRDAFGFQAEALLAVTDAANVASRTVLEKFGFHKVREYQDESTGGTHCVEYILNRPEA